MQKRSIEDVLKEYTSKLLDIPGVVGTGEGLSEGTSCIKVFVLKLTKQLKIKIPENIEGYPVIIVETGMFKSVLRPSKL
jgi:hypothetical protein